MGVVTAWQYVWPWAWSLHGSMCGYGCGCIGVFAQCRCGHGCVCKEVVYGAGNHTPHYIGVVMLI